MAITDAPSETNDQNKEVRSSRSELGEGKRL